MRLSECPSRSNNLQLLRFIASVMVIISHAFSISTGERVKEWLSFITDGQISLGGVSVSVFFCAGGFLIAKSILRVNNGARYFKARIMKIFPALVFVVVVSAFVLGAIVTKYSTKDYYSNAELYKYLLNGVLVLKHNLPGVFETNPYGATVNGALWTLPVEFLCYIACFVLWKINMLKKDRFKWSIPIVALGTILLYMLIEYIKIDILMSAIRPALLFYMGIMFYVYREKIVFTKTKAVISFFIIIISGFAGLLDVGMIMAFPYLLLYICFCLPQVSDKFAKLGDLSYGIYLCGFPIQQTVVFYFGGDMSPFLNMVLSIPLAIICGILIYYFIELPLVKYERRRKGN